MKNIFLLLIFYSGIIIPQSNKMFFYETGEEIKLPKKYRFIDVIGDQKNGFVQLSYKPNQVLSIDVMDNTGLKYVSSEELDISKLGKDLDHEQMVHAGNNYFWFYFFLDEQGFPELDMMQFDIITKKFIGTNRKIIADKKFYKAKKIEYADKDENYYRVFSYKVSRDSSKIIIGYKEANHDEKSITDKYGYYVFDSDMNFLWKKEFEMPIVSKDIRFSSDNFLLDEMVTSSGDVYMLYTMLDRNIKQIDYKKDRKYDLVHLSKDLAEPVHYSFTIENSYLVNFKIKDISDEKLLLGGFYAESTDYISGALLMSLNKKSLNPVFEKTFVQIKPETHIDYNEKMRSNLNYITATDFFVENDGAVLLIGTNNGFGALGSITSRPIVLMKINSSLKLEWTSIIPRKTVCTSKKPLGTTAFYVHQSKNDYNIFYQDDINNKSRPLDKKVGWIDLSYFDTNYSGNITVVNIKPNGQMSKNIDIFGYCDYPQYFKRVSDNDIIIKGGTYYKPFKLANIKLN